MGEVSEAYSECRARIASLTSGLDDRVAAVRVPTCPQWSVHDVVAHVSGVVDDVLAGRLDGIATEPWTAAQVDARRARPIVEMLAEWNTGAAVFETMLDAAGNTGRQAVADLVTHEHDIRAALREPGARDSSAVRIGVGFVADAFVGINANSGISARVCTSDGAEFGAPDASVVLTGDSFEILRAMTGRRSIDQLRELEWQGDVESVLPSFTFGPFVPAAQRIEE